MEEMREDGENRRFGKISGKAKSRVKCSCPAESVVWQKEGKNNIPELEE